MGAVQSHGIAITHRIPAGKHDAAIIQNRRIKIVTLVKRDLLQITAVRIHDMQYKGWLIQ